MEQLLQGFSIFFAGDSLMYCALGVLVGTAVGVLPGIGAIAAVSMLLPITFYLDPTSSLVLLAGVYYGAEYGGGVAAILLNLPGTPASAVVCIEGHEMTKQGRSGVALLISALSSAFGGLIGVTLLVAMTPLIVKLALSLSPADYFCVMLIGLILSGSISSGSAAKGMSMMILGLMLGTMGTDIMSGTVRYGFGIVSLYDGINLVALVMGLFGVSEVIASMAGRKQFNRVEKVTFRSMIPTRYDLARSILPAIRGTGIGALLGALPGTGPTLASFMSYASEKRVSRKPEGFGKGVVEGIAGPEASNNAATMTAFAPTLSLGIPGTPTMAIMIGALMIHGIVPGPRMLTENADLYWAVVASFFVGNILLLVLNVPLIGLWVRLLQIPQHFLFPGIICLICVGVYSVNSNTIDIFVVMIFGVFGYGLRLLGYTPAPLLIGFVLGPLMEEYFRRAMMIAKGDFLSLFTSPISGTLLLISFALLCFSLWSGRTRRKNGY